MAPGKLDSLDADSLKPLVQQLLVRIDDLLAQIAASQAEAGQIYEALHVAGLIRGERRYALRAIAKAQARAGRMAEATQNAHALCCAAKSFHRG